MKQYNEAPFEGDEHKEKVITRVVYVYISFLEK